MTNAVHRELHVLIDPTASWLSDAKGEITLSGFGQRGPMSGVPCVSQVTTPTIVAKNPYTNMSMTKPFWVLVPPIVVTWQSKDLSLFTPSGAPTMNYVEVLPTSATSHNTPASRPSTASRPSGASPKSGGGSRHQGLSGGQIAGIVIGILSFLGIAGILVAFLIRRRRRNRPVHTPNDASASDDHDPKIVNKPEIDGSSIHEITGASKPAEADPSHAISELEGGGLISRNSDSNVHPRVTSNT